MTLAITLILGACTNSAAGDDDKELAEAMETVKNLETIFPNVNVWGVDLGGLTAQEAAVRLSDLGFGNFEGKAVTVNFSLGLRLAIEAGDAGLSISAQEAANLAYQYGRDGTDEENAGSYLYSLENPVEIDLSPIIQIDEDKLESLVSSYVTDVNREMLDEALVIGEKEITVLKGAEALLVDAVNAYEVFYAAFVRLDFSEFQYEGSSEIGDGIDLKIVHDSITIETQNSVYDKETGSVTQEVTGITFDLEAAQKMMDAADEGDTIVIPLVYTQPKITARDLSAVLFRDQLAAKTTSLSGSSQNRINNITLAANAVNGTVLNPGEEFSFNDVVGERSSAKGYKSAPAYAGGQVIESIGGGICQVSSTIYYTTLIANLEVTTRVNHQFIATYLPLGMDATVSWGTIDYKFKNNTDYPIKIVAYRGSSGGVTVELYGTDVTNYTVEMEYIVLSTTPYETIYQEDESIAEGDSKVDTTGSTGYVVETYKYIYDASGSLVSKTYVAKSAYNQRNKVVLVAPGSLEVGGEGTDPAASESPGVSEPPAVSESPQVSVSPGVSSTPDVTASPDVTETPVVTTPGVTETPDVPADSGTTEVPATENPSPETTVPPEIT